MEAGVCQLCEWLSSFWLIVLKVASICLLIVDGHILSLNFLIKILDIIMFYIIQNSTCLSIFYTADRIINLFVVNIVLDTSGILFFRCLGNKLHGFLSIRCGHSNSISAYTGI